MWEDVSYCEYEASNTLMEKLSVSCKDNFQRTVTSKQISQLNKLKLTSQSIKSIFSNQRNQETPKLQKINKNITYTREN